MNVRAHFDTKDKKSNRHRFLVEVTAGMKSIYRNVKKTLPLKYNYQLFVASVASTLTHGKCDGTRINVSMKLNLIPIPTTRMTVSVFRPNENHISNTKMISTRSNSFVLFFLLSLNFIEMTIVRLA